MPVECKCVANTCDYPVAMDTYEGCKHDCTYCEVRQTRTISIIKPVPCAKQLREWIAGKRNRKSNFIDWDIPVKLGTRSDPFQECELQYRETQKVLEIFAETKYPFIIITKNPGMLTQEPYFSLIKECRCVLTPTLGCSAHDRLEPYAPTYEERLEAVRILAPHVTRINARCTPFFPDKYKDIIAEIPRWAEAGIHGAIFCGITAAKKTKGLVKFGSCFCPAKETLISMYKGLKMVLHRNGMKFYAEEPYLRFLGDNLTCCGTDGLEDFRPHTYTYSHLAFGEAEPTPRMLEPGTSYALFGLKRNQEYYDKSKTMSFVDMFHEIENDGYIWWYRKLMEENA